MITVNAEECGAESVHCSFDSDNYESTSSTKNKQGTESVSRAFSCALILLTVFTFLKFITNWIK